MNDPLLYGLVLGAVRFGGDRVWLERALRFRADHTTGEAREVTTTLTDILQENWGSAANIRPVVLSARHHLRLDTSDTELLDDVYRVTAETPFPYGKSNFLNAVYLRAFDIAVRCKAPEDPAKRKAVEDMIQSLWTKARVVGWVVWLGGFAFFAVAAVGLVGWVRGLADGEIRAWIESAATAGISLISELPVYRWATRRKKITTHVRRFTVTARLRPSCTTGAALRASESGSSAPSRREPAEGARLRMGDQSAIRQPVRKRLRQAAALQPHERPGAGVITGMSMSVIVDEALNPALGFAAPSRSYPATTHVRRILGHLLYGLTLAGSAETIYRLTGHSRSGG